MIPQSKPRIDSLWFSRRRFMKTGSLHYARPSVLWRRVAITLLQPRGDSFPTILRQDGPRLALETASLLLQREPDWFDCYANRHVWRMQLRHRLEQLPRDAPERARVHAGLRTVESSGPYTIPGFNPIRHYLLNQTTPVTVCDRHEERLADHGIRLIQNVSQDLLTSNSTASCIICPRDTEPEFWKGSTTP